jgi:hypothetical protein
MQHARAAPPNLATQPWKGPPVPIAESTTLVRVGGVKTAIAPCLAGLGALRPAQARQRR